MKMPFALIACAASACSVGEAVVEVFPLRAHTGLEAGGAQFAVPCVAEHAPDATFTSEDAAVVVVEPGAGSATLRARAPGTTNVVVQAAGYMARAVPVVVTEYPQGAVAAGRALYEGRSCGSCHDGAGQPDVTAAGIAEHSDSEVIASMTGVNPEGGRIEGGHGFDLDADQGVSLVAYMRSLPGHGPPQHDH